MKHKRAYLDFVFVVVIDDVNGLLDVAEHEIAVAVVGLDGKAEDGCQ